MSNAHQFILNEFYYELFPFPLLRLIISDRLLDKVDRTDEPELAEVKVVELQVSGAELSHS